MYLGGCGLYAEVEFADEHTILCRREGHCDLRNESEARLLGVSYSHSGFQTGAAYRVTDPAHWAFTGTGLKQGDLFGTTSLHERCPGGASAHELDKVGPDSPEGIHRLAKGDNPNGTGADLTIYETAPPGNRYFESDRPASPPLSSKASFRQTASGGSPGSVFSAGSLCWTLSLVVDDEVSVITANVLRKFLE